MPGDSGPDGSVLVSTAPPDTTVPASSTSSTSPTTLPAPSAEAWAEFDRYLRDELVGRGDHAFSVAVARRGELLHQAAYGVRVPPPPPPPTTTLAPGETHPPTTPPPETTTTTSSTTTTTTTTTTTVPASGPGASPTGSAGAAPSTTAAPTTTAEPTTTTSTTLPPGEEPVEPTDRFRIASISKLITAAVVMQLVEAGVIELDQPVGQLLADRLGVVITDPLVATITVRHLLSHTSGFNPYQNTFFSAGVSSCAEAGVRGLSGSLDTPPGTHYRYSNMNFCLLGLLVEAVTGEPYERIAQERFLAPLGITDMRLAGTFDVRPDEAEHPSTLTRNYMETLGPAGAWVATAADVVRIADSLDPTRPGWHPVSDDWLVQMRQPGPALPTPGADRWYGLGEIVFTDGTWGHTGTVESTHSMVLVRPDGVTWTILVSGIHPDDSGRLRQFFDEAIAAAGITL